MFFRCISERRIRCFWFIRFQWISRVFRIIWIIRKIRLWKFWILRRVRVVRIIRIISYWEVRCVRIFRKIRGERIIWIKRRYWISWFIRITGFIRVIWNFRFGWNFCFRKIWIIGIYRSFRIQRFFWRKGCIRCFWYERIERGNGIWCFWSFR